MGFSRAVVWESGLNSNFIQLRVLLKFGNELLDSTKGCKFSDQQKLASQEGLCYLELFTSATV
jgi:hypothetical protein